jgi:TIGR03009 family protein
MSCPSACRSLTIAAWLASAAAAQQAPLTFDQTAPAQPPSAASAADPQVDSAPAPGGGPAATPGDFALVPTPGVASAPAAAGGQAPTAAPGQIAAPAPPAAPFQLAPGEEQYVLQTLQLWQAESAKINTFNANFQRYEYDDVFGQKDQAMIWSTGVLSYSKPDKGSFKIDVTRRWTKTDPKNPAPDAPADWVEQKEEVGEHWVCDGKAVYEYEHRLKQLRVTPIPEAMRGQGIVDGPLPFLFGADANKLLARYWIRPVQHPALIWLDAYPKQQADALNYDHVEVMLDPKTMHPTAIQVHLPGGHQKHTYVFETPTINGNLEKWFGALFSAPRTPLGWKKVVMTDEPLPAGQPGNQAANPAAGVPR